MRLNLKILLAVSLVVLIVGGASAAAMVHLQRTAGVRQVEQAAQTLASIIYRGLEFSMVRNNPGEMQEIIRHLRGEPMVRRVDIVTGEGRVWSSSEVQEIGTLLSRPELLQVVKTGKPLVREVASSGELVAIEPVLNGPSCASCHTAEQPVLGAVSVSLDTQRLSRQVASSARWLAGLMALSLAVAIVALSVPISRIVLRPLAALVSGVEQLAAGNYAARVNWQSRDEMGLLASAFNDMAERIQRHTAGLQREVGRLTRWLSELRLFGRTLADTERMDQALAEVVEEVGRLVHADACGITLNGEAARPQVKEWGRVGLLHGDRPVRSWLEFPLAVKERRLGRLVAVRAGEPPFSPEDATLLEAAANLVAIAVDNFRLFEEVREKERLRGQLLTRVMGAQEDERRRIARELHDSVGQSLTGLMLRLDMAIAAVPEGNAELSRRLHNLRNLSEATLEEVRRITYDLRPAALDDLSLADAVAWYARTHLEPAGISVVAETNGCTDRRLPQTLETALFRVAQEALTNVLRHSGANRVRVRLACPPNGDRAVELTVEDDGRGFDLDEVMNRPDHPALGLAGMKERVELLGGTLSISTRPGAGTRIAVRVPLTAAA
ncbi:MAG: histidine kinase [Bacillota bacterium]